MHFILCQRNLAKKLLQSTFTLKTVYILTYAELYAASLKMILLNIFEFRVRAFCLRTVVYKVMYMGKN